MQLGILIYLAILIEGAFAFSLGNLFGQGQPQLDTSTNETFDDAVIPATQPNQQTSLQLFKDISFTKYFETLFGRKKASPDQDSHREDLIDAAVTDISSNNSEFGSSNFVSSSSLEAAVASSAQHDSIADDHPLHSVADELERNKQESLATTIKNKITNYASVWKTWFN